MKPLILVVNDDGIFSQGIKALVEVVSKFGEVVVVAPDKPQSGMGHAITVNNVLRLHSSSLFEGIQAYTCSGTPVDCVKLAIYEVMHRKPDLLVSGINHGANTSTNVLYSGTMSAAIEGAMEHIPSIGFSLCDFNSEADFSEAKEIVEMVVQKVLSDSLPLGVCLNVNIPKKGVEKLKGIQFCKQAYAFWADKFDKRLDQFGNPYYWLTGSFGNENNEEGTDLWAIEQGYATIVPTQFDMTAYQALEKMKNWEL